ncbi:MAG: glycosyltransferase family 4 protein [Nannocystales bacterium]
MSLAPPEFDPTQDTPRRVAFVITRSDAVGGSQLHVQLLAKALNDAGHQAHVFVGEDGPWCRMLDAAGVPFTSLRYLRRAIRPGVDTLGLVELTRALRAFAPDLVSTHATKAGWLGRVAARALRIPSVFTVHGWPLSPGRLAPARHAIRLAEQACAWGSGAMIFVSGYDRRVAEEHGIGLPHQRVVVHNALPDVAAALRCQPVDTQPEVLMVARLERPKDPLLAIEALAQLRALPWHFTLVGDGPLRASVQARLSEHGLLDRVTLAGTVSDVPQRLAGSQVFLLASRREGLPLSVLEAMRAALPVVSTDAGGVCEAVADGETGFVVPRDDVSALADALRALIVDPSLRVRMGAAGRARYESEFSFVVHLRRIWAIYRRAMQERPAR